MTVARSMTSALGWLGDRVNPIVVKEARQAVRSASVIVVLSLLLAILFVVTMVVVMYEQGGLAHGDRGADLFLTLNGVVMGLCLLFVPIYSAVRLSGERSGASADLMHVTTISPASIVWGKLVAAMMISMLFFSMAAPFLMLTYLFRGIDLVTIAFIVTLELFVCLAASQVGVFIASLPVSGLMRGLMGLIAVPLALYTLTGVGAVLFMSGVSVTMLRGGGWWVVAVAVFLLLIGTGALFTLSVAACSPAPSNRAWLPRVYFTACWAASLALVAFLTGVLKWGGATPSWYNACLVLGCAGMWLAVGERREIGQRIRARLPRSPLKRALAFLFTSGPASGLAWSGAIIALSFIAVHAMVWTNSLSGSHTLATVTTALTSPLWVLVHGLLAVHIRDGWLKNRCGPETTVPIAVGLASAASLIPMIVAFVIWPQSWDRKSWLLVTNVAAPLFVDDTESLWYAFLAAAASACVLLLTSRRWITAQIRAFRQIETANGASDGRA